MIRDFVLSFVLAACLMASLLASLAPSSNHPYLALRIFPRVGIQPLGVTLTASIEGELTEEWYCPGVEWTWSDGTHSAEESDCEPWNEGRAGATKVWIRRRLLGEGHHVIQVKLSKAGRTLGRAEAEIDVQ